MLLDNEALSYQPPSQPVAQPVTQASSRRQPKHLQIAFRSGCERLATPDGTPIWPVCTRAQLQALVHIASVFGADLRTARAAPAAAHSSSAETVLALGYEAFAAGQLYAHLTGRQFLPAADFAQVRDAAFPALVVTTPHWLHSKLLAHLYERVDAGGQAPGIICAEPEALETQVLVRAAAATLAGPLRQRRNDILPLTAIGRVICEEHATLGGRADPHEVRNALQQASGIILLDTHSDGVDASLGAKLTLCPMNHMPPKADRRRANRCVHTGYCHRHERTVAEMLGSDTLLFPEDIRARILLLSVCWGLLPANGLVDAAWGIGARLLNSCTLGAVVTTWEIAFPNFSLLEELARSIQEGDTVGRALYQFNHSLAAQSSGLRLCLLGDPWVHLPPRGIPHQSAAVPGALAARSTEEDVAIPLRERRPVAAVQRLDTRTAGDGDLTFLELLLRSVAASDEYRSLSPHVQSAAQTAIVEIERAQAEISRRAMHQSAHTLDPGRSLREAVLQYICDRGHLVIHSWSSYASLRRVERQAEAHCFACRNLKNDLVTLIATFDVPSIARRRISSCACCGIVEDMPEDAVITMSVLGNNEIELGGQLPREDWTARFVIRTKVRGQVFWWDWPSDSNGAPRARFTTAEAWPIGPLDVAVVLMHRAKLIVTAQRVSSTVGQQTG